MNILAKSSKIPFWSARNFSSLPENSVSILTATSTNIIFNLATEEYLYEKSKILHPMLFLWRNDKTIVIGKHQNPWKECKIQNMQAAGVNLARRKSGGGAVYQDLGNTCFSFLNPITEANANLNFKDLNNDVIMDAMREMGIPNAEASGRNDIIINGKKVSGSAYKVRPKNRTLHHGTMLISLDKEAAQNYLNPNIQKLQSKGVDSVRARIMNLTEQNPSINHDVFCKAMSNAFKKKYKGVLCEEKIIHESDLAKIPEIDQVFKETSTWEWRFGETPEFTNAFEKKFDWGMFEICFNVKNAIIQSGKIYSDCLYPDFIDTFNAVLLNPNTEYSVHGWNGITEQMEAMCTGNDLYQQLIRDVKQLVNPNL